MCQVPNIRKMPEMEMGFAKKIPVEQSYNTILSGVGEKTWIWS
jgi:hypothetical protein